MPRQSTLVILLATVVLYAIGFSGAVPAGIFLAMGLELVVWKRASDRVRAMRLARVARPVRLQRRR